MMDTESVGMRQKGNGSDQWTKRKDARVEWRGSGSGVWAEMEGMNVTGEDGEQVVIGVNDAKLGWKVKVRSA